MNSIDDIFNFDIPQELPTGNSYEYFLGLKNREIWIDTNIEVDEGITSVIKQIIRWNREDLGKSVKIRKPIIIYCFSFGGELDLCNAIIDTIRASKTPVYCVNAGRCMSAAAYIYISGHKRFTFKHSNFLFHQGSGSLDGNYAEISSQMEDYKKKVENLTDLMRKYTKYSEEEINKNITTEWYVSSEEALNNGVCDKIIDNIEEILF